MPVFVDRNRFVLLVSTGMPVFMDRKRFVLLVSTGMPVFVDRKRFVLLLSTEMPAFVDRKRFSWTESQRVVLPQALPEMLGYHRCHYCHLLFSHRMHELY